MAQLRQDKEAFDKRDILVVVVGPEDKERFSEYWKKNNMPFVGIPDKKHKVLKDYGQEVDLFKLGRMPGQMLIDKEGILRYVHYGHSMKDIPDNQEILGLVDEEA